MLRSAFEDVCVAVLDSLRQMGGFDVFGAGQIGDGTGHAEDAVVGAGGEPLILPFSINSSRVCCCLRLKY